MRLLLDQNMDYGLRPDLTAAGHDVAAVRDRDSFMPDLEVVAWAIAERRVIISEDQDIPQLVRECGRVHEVGLISVRLHELKRESSRVNISAAIAMHQDLLGSILVV